MDSMIEASLQAGKNDDGRPAAYRCRPLNVRRAVDRLQTKSSIAPESLGGSCAALGRLVSAAKLANTRAWPDHQLPAVQSSISSAANPAPRTTLFQHPSSSRPPTSAGLVCRLLTAESAFTGMGREGPLFFQNDGRSASGCGGWNNKHPHPLRSAMFSRHTDRGSALSSCPTRECATSLFCAWSGATHMQGSSALFPTAVKF